MKFDTLLSIIGDEPVFETGLLLAGDVDAVDVRRQLSRWVKSGKLYQIRRGLYALAPPFRKTVPHPFVVANRLIRASCVSLQSALAHAGMIPEHVPMVTSVTTQRPGDRTTPLGRFRFRHIQPAFFFGYGQLTLENGQKAFVAHPEKALLDLVYLEKDGNDPAYLEELRLQHADRIDAGRLRVYGERMGKPKLRAAVERIEVLIGADDSYETL